MFIIMLASSRDISLCAANNIYNGFGFFSFRCFPPLLINCFAILQGPGGRPGFGRGSGGFGAPTSSNIP